MGEHRDRLEAIPVEKQQDMMVTEDGHRELLRLRRRAYAEHMVEMTHADEVVDVLGQLQKKYGMKVRIWNQVLDWPTALMIVRYGEAIDFWPTEFSKLDHDRAVELLNGVAWPSSLRKFVPEDEE